MAATALNCCLALPSKFRTLSINNNTCTSSSSSSSTCLSFSTNLSRSNVFSNGGGGAVVVQRRPVRRSVVCEVTPGQKPDSAAKRARQAEKRRIYNKSKKSEAKTRMKKVLEALDGLKKKSDAQSEEVITIEKLIAEAYSAIDKAVKAGSLHKNTGARRKSRLARNKKAVEVHHGWYTPEPASLTA